MLVIASTILLFRCGWANEFRITPSIAITEKYNDNISLSDKNDNPERDWITTISPALLLGTRTERLDVSLSGRLDGNYYAKYDNRNKWDHFYDGRLHYRATDRLGLGIQGGYSITYSEDRDIDVTGLVQPSGRQDRSNVGASVDYRLGNLTTASLSYNYDKTRYDQQEDDDSWGQTAGFSLSRELSPTTKGRLNFGYSNYHYTDSTSDSYKGTLGFSKDFSEKWSVLFDLGANFTHTTFSDEWGSTGLLTVNYKDDYNSGSIGLSKDVLPSTSRDRNGSSSTDRTALSLNFRRRFTQELSGFLQGGYYWNRSDAGQYSREEIDERTATGSAGIRYDFTKDIYLEASYKYTRVEHDQTDTYAEQNLVLVRLYLQHSFLMN
ncbi:MAG: outer membrane beta-barrel protein [Smithella sp.]